MTTLRRPIGLRSGPRQSSAPWRGLELSVLSLPEGIAFHILEGAAFRRVFAPRRDTVESAALHLFERASLRVLDWIAWRSAG